MRRHAAHAGFTVIELVMTIVIVGALAAVAMPRFMDKSLEERGFRDSAKALLTHAAHIAVATRRYTCVTVTPGIGSAGTLSITMDVRAPESFATGVSCGATVPMPSPASGCPSNAVCGARGVSLLGTSAGSFIFDPLGRSVTANKVVAANGVVNISNQPSITVYGETGLIE